MNRRSFPNRTLSSPWALAEAAQLAYSRRHRFHIVNGIWAEPAFATACCVLAGSNAKFAIYSEASKADRARSALRVAVRNGFGRWVAKRLAGALSVSHFARQSFVELGVPESRIFDFGYFRNGTTAAPLPAPATAQFLFLGMLAHHKGVDLLLRASQQLQRTGIQHSIRLAGAGESEAQLRALARELGVEASVDFTGVVPSAEVGRLFSNTTALVLPSRLDGWGMVVNEALMAGVPVIVSDACGAADLIGQGREGFVFRSEDVSDLASRMEQLLRADAGRMRRAASDLGARLSPAVVAPYMIACIRHMLADSPRPGPPWQQPHDGVAEASHKEILAKP
jgi:glycosyltransferase involved in cell wall biosynthesis